MPFIDYLIWGVVALVIGGPVGIGFYKLTHSYSKKQEKKKIFDFLEEKTPNNLKIDGETINVKKFIYKQNDGELINVEIADIAKKAKIEGLKQEKTPFLKRIIQKVFSSKTKPSKASKGKNK